MACALPELPDITVYVEALERFIAGHRLDRVQLQSPFLLRTANPPITAAEGRRVATLRRLGKRIVWGLEGDLYLVFHLMIAGRFHWKRPGAALQRRSGLAAFDFEAGSLHLTEASSKKRASLHVVAGAAGLAAFHAGGIEPLEDDFGQFVSALQRENHTLKRALTDPAIVSGVGNAYSDEILHRARLSPVTLSQKLDRGELRRLHRAMRETLVEWTQRLREETGEAFPEKVTAFRDGMAVHGRFGKPCPVCGAPVQRIVRAENETNYCATCQTGGKLLADRALSRLLGKDWPRSLDEMERHVAARRAT